MKHLFLLCLVKASFDVAKTIVDELRLFRVCVNFHVYFQFLYFHI